MPHKTKDGDVIPRTTEILATSECEERAYHTKKLIGKMRRGEVDGYNNVLTFATIRGTLIHHRVENFLRVHQGLPELPLKLNPNEEKFLFQIEQNKELKEELDKKIMQGYMNFLDFWNEVQPEVLAIEESVIGKMNGIRFKGTMDSVLLVEESKLDEIYGITPRSDEKRIIICDWKSGSSAQASHKVQIAAYYHLAQQNILPRFLDKYEYYKVKGLPVGMDVYFGGGSYTAKMFDISKSLFSHIVGLFKKAERVPRNKLFNNRIGIQLIYCLYCPFRSECSAFLEEEVPLLNAEEFEQLRQSETYPHSYA